MDGIVEEKQLYTSLQKTFSLLLPSISASNYFGDY